MPITSAWSSCPQCGKALFKDDDACQSCGYELAELDRIKMAFDIDQNHKMGVRIGIFVFGLAVFLFILILLW
ncbi:hypothetical protein IMCC21906_00089 [Spongiibacter sp. IMCC21906]|nr:hypothetical protein IMCC21906_00089 [Spongiibacter sp. IMCC21906]